MTATNWVARRKILTQKGVYEFNEDIPLKFKIPQASAEYECSSSAVISAALVQLRVLKRRVQLKKRYKKRNENNQSLLQLI